ncbi:hypothetical protein LCGC14_0254040 [marine sediment metagenome]|uniref:Uncharacterized protein n=1 Tax=marine sediment metagenome TaxID=412755 RepID=A0A0F9X8F4_9ZZZZ|nr:hypothetical protein [Phycisphaerae bacterium]
MKSHLPIAMAILGLLAGPVAMTQIACKRKLPATPVTPAAGTTSGAGGYAQTHAQLLAELDMADAQRETVSGILEAFRKDVTQWTMVHNLEMKQLRSVMKRYHGPKTDETDKEIMAAVRKSDRLETERNAKDTQLMADLEEVLSKEQLAKATEILYPVPPTWASGTTNRFHHLAELGLTEEQLAQTKTIMDEAMAASGGMGGTAMQAAWNRIVKEVLTDENRELLQDLIKKAGHQRMVLAMFGHLRLTKDQLAKIDAIWTRAYDSAKAAEAAGGGPDAKFEIYENAQKEIKATVLTDEQRGQLGGGGAGMPGGGYNPHAR